MNEYTLYAEQLWRDGKRSFEDLNFDEKACLAGLIMQKSDSIEDFLDTNRLTTISETLAALMTTYDKNYNHDTVEYLREDLSNNLIQGAIAVAKVKVIDNLFVSFHCCPPDDEE